ncbi:response regulator transcription factor [Undibacterium fentianense]|uniref:Response regulator transcription factor n=1 Tax=Undibacterium fentianense TaxID=2828728 RepID=A0A941IEF1_9BURK|nr:response regulator transcription factor [Undibacterium fentianense]MBR7799337.1 response regulator transcription factor [Undibacterium fentianense]
MKLFEQVSLTQHVFCSTSMEMPSSLKKAFPSVKALPISNVIVDEKNNTIVWLHLHANQTIAAQLLEVKQKVHQARIIAMSDMPNDLEALAVFSMLAKAYCNTHAGVEVLMNIASVVEQGGIWIGESIMQKLLGQNEIEEQKLEKVLGTWSKLLTGRELEVAKAIAVGLTNKEIATQMHITERTVKAHVGAVLDKLQLKNRLQLALLVKDS